jgi:hypothetical protein
VNGTTDVTITINGVAVTVPGQKSLAKKGANSDITSLSGLTTALSIGQGGTGAKTAADARTNLGLGSTDTRPFLPSNYRPHHRSSIFITALPLTITLRDCGPQEQRHWK